MNLLKFLLRIILTFFYMKAKENIILNKYANKLIVKLLNFIL